MIATSFQQSARHLVATFGVLASVAGAHAYDLIGSSWPTGDVTFQLQLDATAPASPTLPLTDGSPSWNAVGQAAIDDWNAQLGRSKLRGATSTSSAAKLGDAVNNVTFSNTVYGQEFGERTLAVTMIDHYDGSDGMPTVKTNETDVIVNTGRTWDSYRGSLRSGTIDLKRVLIHEYGHALGLDHPDQALPAQTVTAIMNSSVSSVETLRADDINGAKYLYGTVLSSPSITQQPVGQTALVGDRVLLSVGTNGAAVAPAGSKALLAYVWYCRATGGTTFERIVGADGPSLEFGTVQASDAGTYYVKVVTPDGEVKSQNATVSVNPIATSSQTALLNLSTRGVAGSGSSTMIVGFVVKGTKSKTVLLRAVGPALGPVFGLTGTLPDPKLTLFNQTGTEIATGTTLDQASNGAELRDTSQRVGAFALPTGSKDALLLATLAPGDYTAHATSPSGKTGVVLVEAYDVDRDPASRLVNLSTRGNVGTGANVMIAGFVVEGPGPRSYLIRVSGPSLKGAPWNLTGTLIDPILTLFDRDSVQVRTNDDWDSPPSVQKTLNSAFQKVGAFGYPYPSTGERNQRDDTAMQSAMVVTLQPGPYTAQASGNPNDGDTDPTGNALIEIYEMPAE